MTEQEILAELAEEFDFTDNISDSTEILSDEFILNSF
jgi:hypothetical protein